MEFIGIDCHSGVVKDGSISGVACWHVYCVVSQSIFILGEQTAMGYIWGVSCFFS